MPKDSMFDVGYRAVNDDSIEYENLTFENLLDFFSGALHKIVTSAKCSDLPDGVIYEMVHNAIQCERECAKEEAVEESATEETITPSTKKDDLKN